MKTEYSYKELRAMSADAIRAALPEGTRFSYGWEYLKGRTLRVVARTAEKDGLFEAVHGVDECDGKFHRLTLQSGDVTIIGGATGALAPANDGHMNIKDAAEGVMKYIGNIGVPKEDLRMVEAGLEDPAGTPTEEGLRAMALLLYRENRAKLVDVVGTKADEEEKSGRKR